MERESETKIASQILKVWRTIKSKYPYSIVFIRVGEKYSTFGNDAVTLNQLTFTKILTNKQNIQECVFPFGRLDAILTYMVKAGCQVAVCDRLESA